MACTRSKLEVESARAKLKCFHGCARNSVVDFTGGVHGGRKTKLLTVVQTRESNSIVFEKPPQATDDKTGLVVENKNPIELTPRE